MKTSWVLLTTVWLMSLCGITSAQDRGFASAIEWSPDGETIAIASTTGVWFFDTEFNDWASFKSSKASITCHRDPWTGTPPVILLLLDFPMYATVDKHIQIIDVDELAIITEIVHPLLWTQVEWHLIDNLLAAGSWSGEAHVWDALTGEARFDFEESDEQTGGNRNSTMAVCWFSESVIAVATQWELYIVDVEVNESLQSFDIRNDFYPPVCHDERKIIRTPSGMFHVEAGAYSEDFKPWRDENDWSRREIIFPRSSELVPEAQDGKFSPDGSKYLYSGEGCRIHVLDVRDGRLLAQIRGGIYFVQEPSERFVDSLAWHPGGSRFAAVGQFGGIRIGTPRLMNCCNGLTVFKRAMGN